MTKRHTEVSIYGDQFFINGEPTYKGRTWNGHRIEGLLLNSRMVQGAFDDLNPETRHEWAYPDTGVWDAERNTREFVAAMPSWREHGMLGLATNLQGGNPRGYSRLGSLALINSTFNADGSLRPDYLARFERILDRADELGMVVILGLFYFGQEGIFKGNEDAIHRAVDNALDWLFDHDYRHVLIEINNETNIVYKTPLFMPDRVHELIEQAQARTRAGQRFLVSTSYGGNHIPRANVVSRADYMLMHGNGVSDPNRIIEMVQTVRAMPEYRPMPIVFNEDDHFDFDKPFNNFVAAVSQYASWGYFDYRMEGEGFEQGFQSVPADWGIHSDRKRGFFNLMREMTSG
jgi:hypothetical protein